MPLISAHNRVLLAIGGLGLAAALSIGLAFMHLQTADDALNVAFEVDGELHEQIFHLAGAGREREDAIQDYVRTRDPEALERYRLATQAEIDIGDAIEATAADIPDVTAAMGAFTAATGAWQATFADPILVQIGRDPGAPVAPLTDSFEIIVVAIDTLRVAAQGYSESLDVMDEGVTEARSAATLAALAVTLFAALISLWFVRRYGRALERDVKRSDVLNRFTEATSFAADDRAVARASIDAMNLLAHPDSAVVHVLNPSQDRAVPEAKSGEGPAEVLPLYALSGCPGIARGSIYVTSDATAALSAHCPVYPIESGTLACVPLAQTETVGAAHLHWNAPNAFPPDVRVGVARVAEYAAMTIGNRRLLALLEGQASTDPRTGLANSRSFDHALTVALAAQVPGEMLAVLLVDVDRFKDFNDRYGHHAGDEALRAFAGALRSCMRPEDLAARYGGEEFAVLLPGADAATALAVAERIRSRTEATLVPLGPGNAAQITVSVGVAVAPIHGSDRVSLLQIADGALYEAKNAGRNQVGYPGPATALSVPSALVSVDAA